VSIKKSEFETVKCHDFVREKRERQLLTKKEGTRALTGVMSTSRFDCQRKKEGKKKKKRGAAVKKSRGEVAWCNRAWRIRNNDKVGGGERKKKGGRGTQPAEQKNTDCGSSRTGFLGFFWGKKKEEEKENTGLGRSEKKSNGAAPRFFLRFQGFQKNLPKLFKEGKKGEGEA